MILIGGGLNRPGKLARKIRTMTTGNVIGLL
jgi:hypothetical protein